VLLRAHGAAPLLATCAGAWQQLQAFVAALRRAGAAGCEAALEAELTVARLEATLANASGLLGNPGAPSLAWGPALQKLETLEVALHTELRYTYGMDWEMKPGKLVSKKGTWLKTSARFSWELPESQKLYVPQGVLMPVMQIGKVTDPVELKQHDWVCQHLLVWMKPAIVRTLEARRNTWFVYWPHWEDKGVAIVAMADTWLKRSTQMSGDLQPFELIYVPKGLPLRLAQAPSVVDEEWEKFRHQHVHQHRRVVLAGAPLTVKQDQYDLLAGQAAPAPQPPPG